MLPSTAILTVLLTSQVWLEAPTVKAQWVNQSQPSFHAKEPQRIVCLAPSATEYVFALGEGSRVVGVSRYADYPAAVVKIPKVGGFIDPNLEKIIELRPDLVIAVTNATVMPVLIRLTKLKIPVLAVPGNSFADSFHAGAAIANALGPRAEMSAQVLFDRMKIEINKLKDAAARRRRLKVAFVYGYRPLILAGPGSFADTILSLLNSENIVKIPENYPSYSLERLLADGPEVILDGVSGMGAKNSGIDWSKWTSIPAVKNHRVHHLKAMSVLRAGPRLLDAIKIVADVLSKPSRGPGRD